MMSVLTLIPWGTVFGGIGGYFKKKQDNKFSLEMMDKKEIADTNNHTRDMALLDKEIEKTTLLAEVDLEKEHARVDGAALMTAVKSQDAEVSALAPVAEKSGPKMIAFMGFVFTCITALQKSIRPVITMCLYFSSCVIMYTVHKKVGSISSTNQVAMLAIYEMVIFSILNMTELAITFWFASSGFGGSVGDASPFSNFPIRSAKACSFARTSFDTPSGSSSFLPEIRAVRPSTIV